MVHVKKLWTFYDFSRARPSAEIRVVEVNKLRLLTIFSMRALPSEEIRVVEVQKLGTSYDFRKPRATLCGDSRGRAQKTGDFLRFLQAARDALQRFAWSRFKNWSFLRFLQVARVPVRRFAWSRFKNWRLFTISARCARPSAEIRVVEVQKLGTSYDFCKPRATLCADRANLLLAKWPLEVVSWLARLLSQSRGRGFDTPLVRGSSGLKIAAFEYKRSTRSVLLQLRLENRNF